MLEVFYRAYTFIRSIRAFFVGLYEGGSYDLPWLNTPLIVYRVIALQVIAVSIIFFIVTFVRFQRALAAARARNLGAPLPAAEPEQRSPLRAAGDTRWEEVVKRSASESPAEWKEAIFIADAMLGELLTVMGYRGEDIGERLKNIEPSDFVTLDDAWEAHKFRNRLAHDSVGLPIAQREARRIIGLYEKVFREFGYL